jgi:glycosyltransferase involved in cell wall biosynthesis
MRTADVLYITQNGVSDHIGQSQVAPYLVGLSQKGFRIHLLSAEKPCRDKLIARYRRDFDAAGIAWTYVPYRASPRYLGQARTQLNMRAAARRIVQSEGVRVVHCRSFPPALIGWELKRRFGMKFIFDFRDFYADEGLVKERGFRKSLSRGLKRVEGPMIRAAAKVVCLTERAKSILAGLYLDDDPRALERFQVVPCCADFSHFDPSLVSESDLASARSIVGVSPDDFVLLYLGSLGPDYLLDRMMALFVQLLREQPNARFVFLANNGEDLVEAARTAHGVPRERISFASADRDQVPAFLTMAHASVIFIRADLSKAGCSPTKLAELFACGVPVIANAGVGDMDRVIDPRTNGSVLVSDLSDDSLRDAAKRMLSIDKTVPIRENSRQFDLPAGVAKYAAVYKQLLAH